MKRKKQGLTLMEERFCQLVALGKTAREAYSDAFSVAITDERRKHSIDNRASRLAKRADIAGRIVEAAGEARRQNREMWERRGEELADKLYARVVEADSMGALLSRDVLKGIEVLARLKGLNAPEETVLKDGGRAATFTPRGIEGMSEADLRAIIEVEGEVREKEGGE